MCKFMEDMRKEAAILAYIQAYRECSVPESKILSTIMKKYNLNEADAESYMELSKDIA